MDVMDADSLRAKVRQVVNGQERFCKDVQAAVAVSREINGKLRRVRLCCPSLLLVILSCTLLFVGKV